MPYERSSRVLNLIYTNTPEDARLNCVLNARMLETYHRKLRCRAYLILFLVKALLLLILISTLLPVTGYVPKCWMWVLVIPAFAVILDIPSRIYASYRHSVEFSEVYAGFAHSFNTCKAEVLFLYERRYLQVTYLDSNPDQALLNLSKQEVLKQAGRPECSKTTT